MMLEHQNFNKIDIYAYQSAKKGEDCNGDVYFVKETDEYFLCAVADGLGSGRDANASSEAAISVIKDHHDEDVKSLMERANDALHLKRGAVLAIFKIYYKEQELEYSCVGNIRFMLRTEAGKVTYPMPTMGFLSGRPQQVTVQRFPFEKGTSFLIHSDGLEIYSIKKYLWDVRSIRDTYQSIKEMIQNPKDDITFLIGKFG